MVITAILLIIINMSTEKVNNDDILIQSYKKICNQDCILDCKTLGRDKSCINKCESECNDKIQNIGNNDYHQYLLNNPKLKGIIPQECRLNCTELCEKLDNSDKKCVPDCISNCTKHLNEVSQASPPSNY